jgi:hypothetical protein
MVISISSKLWNDAITGNQTSARIIRHLLTLIELGKHNIIFEGEIDIVKIIESNEFISFREIIIAQYELGFYSPTSKIIVRITNNNNIEHLFADENRYFSGKLMIQIKEGIEFQYLDTTSIDTYLNKPLHILVENRESDGFFITQIYNLLTEKEFANEKNVVFVHGGGSTMEAMVETIDSPIRQICIIDSDKRFPEAQIPAKIMTLTEKCNEKYTKLYMLNRREIENYIPDEALKKWLLLENRKTELEHQYFEFEKDQKAFFDLKKGLKAKDFEIEEIQRLYTEVYTCLTPEDLVNEKKVILEGFGRNIWEAFNQVSSSNEFCHDSKLEFDQLIETIEAVI